jgi:Cys-tRNA(Pro)/Cys-tRNA(Cys) deacylase
MKRTRAIDILERARISYELREFSAVEFTVEETSERLGLPLNVLFKTLVAEGEHKGMVMALVPGNAQLSLSKLAKAMGDKRCSMIDVEDLFRITGYLKGGCSPLGAKKALPVFIDSSALQLERVAVSAGLRGLQMLLRPQDLQAVTRGTVTELRDTTIGNRE